MLTQLERNAMVVSKVRVRGRRVDALAARVRVDSFLAGVEATPPGLPPSATLLVRRLGTTIRVRAGNGSRAAREDPNRVLRAELALLARRAVRPAREAVPSSAEAVLFQDPGELIACLARDFVAGACSRWWWKSLFPHGVDEAIVIRAWCERIGSVPAAVQLLERRGLAVAFLERVSIAAVRQTTNALTSAFGLRELAGALEAVRANAVKRAARHDELEIRERPSETAGEALTKHLEFVEPFTPAQERECLRGVALALAETPTFARSTRFAEIVEAWGLLASERRWLEDVMALGTKPAGQREEPVRDAKKRAGTLVPHDSALSTADFTTPRAAAERSAPERIAPPAPASESRPPTEERDPPAASHAAPHTAITPIERRESPPAVAEVQGGAAELSPLPQTVQTEYGGVLYLVNLALALELYGDFTRPLEPGLALSIWDFLALVGERLAGSALRADPLWGLLATLAGRDGAEPGEDFTPPEEWRMPCEWLRPFAHSEPWTWSVANRRLRVEHPAGFSVLDVRLADRALDEALKSELECYAPVELGKRVRSRRAKKQRPLERWLDGLLPYCRARLRLALDLARDADPGPMVCRHLAHVSLSSGALDVSLGLEELPFEIRRSGLDRDPGWVPAAGREIRFHFESATRG